MKSMNQIGRLLLLCLLVGTAHAQKAAPQKGYYQIVVYHFTDSSQGNILHAYLEKAYLPALHRQRIQHVGVFTPIANDTAASKELYVLFPLQSFNQAAKLGQQLDADAQYVANGKQYLDAPYNHPPYTRMETILLEQFRLAPFFSLPKLKSSVADKIYELRSYESATEKIFANKVEMFNEGGEIDLFKSLNFNAVFYGSVIAGCHMPNLMYMTSFENMADRDQHWKQFGESPVWKQLSSQSKYQNNVSTLHAILMKATPYSDF